MTIFMLGHLLVGWVGEVGWGSGEGIWVGLGGRWGWEHPFLSIPLLLYGSSLCLPVENTNFILHVKTLCHASHVKIVFVSLSSVKLLYQNMYNQSTGVFSVFNVRIFE